MDTPVRPLVLVVDDDPAVLEALGSLLAPRLEPLFAVETAASAEEALELVGDGEDARPLALVITDEKMPGRQGTEMLVMLRELAAHEGGGRIVITAYAGLESLKRAINEAEVDRYFPKPWNAAEDVLPTVGEILSRFLRARGFDRFLEVAPAEGEAGREEVRAVRRAWQEYELLLGEEDLEEEIELPPVDEPGDDDALLLVSRRRSPRDDRPAGTIRLRRDGDGFLLDALAFVPEEAADAHERLLVLAGVLHAASRGEGPVRARVPAPRVALYEALGFVRERGVDPPGTWLLAADPAAVAREHPAHATRLGAGGRPCACFQEACPARDYAAERRGYLCPLDLLEGRVPDGFPGA